jgi:hypothetical protein
MSRIDLSEQYGLTRTNRGVQRAVQGELEFIFRDPVSHHELGRRRETNIIKIFAKEVLSHRVPSPRVWDPAANTGSGGWVAHNLPLEDWAPRYICFGASFDDNGTPLDADDERYYSQDEVSGGYVPRALGIGAEYGGGLINAIPISSPNIPLKRIERIFFESSYQPAGTPLLEADVRAINNIMVLETTLRKDEYNGFGANSSDFFTIAEVALVAAREIPPEQGLCECDPSNLFLEGDPDEIALDATSSGTATVSLASSVVDPLLINLIREGDQIKLVAHGANRQGTPADLLNQITPYYLVTSKVSGGKDLVLDRTPVDANNNPIVGPVGVFKDGFKIFSHRILKIPIKKSADFEIVVRWRIIYN